MRTKASTAAICFRECAGEFGRHTQAAAQASSSGDERLLATSQMRHELRAEARSIDARRLLPLNILPNRTFSAGADEGHRSEAIRAAIGAGRVAAFAGYRWAKWTNVSEAHCSQCELQRPSRTTREVELSEHPIVKPAPGVNDASWPKPAGTLTKLVRRTSR